MKEIWKDIKGYEGIYEISNKGNVKNIKNNKILKGTLDGRGYLFVWLYKDGVRKRFRIHRLVALHFVSNPLNKPFIDHIDTDRTNNDFTNLRWCTQKENMNNSVTKEKLKVSNKLNISLAASKSAENRKKKVICINTGKIFDSLEEAAKSCNLCNGSHITACCRGKRKTAGKLPDGTPLQWKYID